MTDEAGAHEGGDISPRTYRLGVGGLLLLSALLHLWLVWSGGQFTQLDEARYYTSRESARLLAEGDWRRALGPAGEAGDHVGAKLLGIVPEVLGRRWGADVRIPALFFGGFSLAALVALAGVARALGLARETRLWLLAFAAGSGSLFYFSRHLLPYDAALAFMLLALWAGLAERRVWWRALLAGLAAGAGFVTYYGYWTLGAVVLVAGTLVHAEPTRAGLRGFLGRAGLAGLGLAAAVAAPVAADRAWGQGRLIEGARSLSGTITVGDFRGHIAPWEYLWAADRLLVPAALVALVFLGVVLARGGEPRLRRAAWLAVAAVIVLQAMFIVGANLRHQFAAHDRLIRQLTPFLCLAAAVAVEAVRHRRGWRQWGRGLAAAAWLANSLFTLGVPLRQEFPREFKRRGDELLRRLEAAAPPRSDSYHRYVNVLHYLFQPEVLEAEPLETLLAAPHFYNYTPYLFEAKTPADRAYRQSIDQRMRLVRMPVRAEEKIGGDRYGPVRMRVAFVGGCRTFVEPLLSVGPRDDGEVFSVHYVADDVVRFGFFSTGFAMFFSEPVPVELGRSYEIELFSSSLCRPPEMPAANQAEQHARDQPFMSVRCDGREVLRRRIPPKRIVPEQVYAAVNAVLTDTAGARFSGTICDVRRGGRVPLPDYWIGEVLTPIPARLRLQVDFDGMPAGAPEPLVTGGEPGNALLVFARRVDDTHIRLGIEWWGSGVRESEILAAGPGLHVVEADLSAAASPADGVRAVKVRLDGAPAVEFPVLPGMGITTRAVTLGMNGPGGSLVHPLFHGRITRYEAEP